jgi:hypothetical protein
VYQPALTPSPSVTASPSASIFRYDPASNTWREVTKPPAEGILFDVTPANASADVLWFVGANSGQSALYRYVM